MQQPCSQEGKYGAYLSNVSTFAEIYPIKEA